MSNQYSCDQKIDIQSPATISKYIS